MTVLNSKMFQANPVNRRQKLAESQNGMFLAIAVKKHNERHKRLSSASSPLVDRIAFIYQRGQISGVPTAS